MDLKTLSTVFTSVFIAELGDKTQLATMLFASDKDTSKLTVFLGAAAALVVTSALGVSPVVFCRNTSARKRCITWRESALSPLEFGRWQKRD